MSCLLFGQLSAPDGYYQFPINPGQSNYLSGTVGEIRATHFHAGIDVKTRKRTGLPVHATADGYVFRIKVSTKGYGQVLYMIHPNETFSVYAHLDSYAEPIEKYVKQKQYEKESYELELFPKKNQLYYQKGEIIGYSGNTGATTGPHLHFEIRNANNQAIDLLQFRFKEIQDQIAPIVQKVAFITLDKEAKINGLFGRYEFDIVHTENTYRTNAPIQLKGRIGVEILSYDLMNNNANKNGMVKTTMLIDNDTVFHENKETLSFAHQRNTLKHYNYQAYKNGNGRFNKLYLDDGNEHHIYVKTHRGFPFENQQKIQIFTEDSYHNRSLTEININSPHAGSPPIPKFENYEILGNKMHLKSKEEVHLKLNDKWKALSPYYADEKINYYIWDMDNGLPQFIFMNGEMMSTNLITSIPSYQQVVYRHEEFEIHFDVRSLFDTLHLRFRKTIDTTKNRELFQFINHQDPIRSNIEILLTPTLDYNQEKTAAYSVARNKYHYLGGNWINNRIAFKTRELVTYTLLTDSIPPKITRISTTPSKMQFKIKDNLSGIKSYRATINNKFLLMRYEPKKNVIWPIPYEPNTPLKGNFALEVMDNVNNKTIYKLKL